jgi:hypothetical protein
MEPDPSDLPTPPSIPVPPAQQAQPRWPGRTGDQPPTQRLPWPLLAVIAGIAIVVLIALLFGLLLSARGGTTTVLVVAPVDQTATAISAQATASAASTASANATGTATRATATPQPPSPAVHVVTAQGTVTTGSSVAANCPNGELALSGGWLSTANAPIYNSSRSGNGWRVFPRSASGAQVTVSVMCLQHVAGASITEHLVRVTADAGRFASGVATCTAGEIPIGGGFANPTPGVEVVQLKLASDLSGISGDIVNSTGSAQVTTFYSECPSASGAHVLNPPPHMSMSVSPGASASIAVPCPQGSLLAGGGFDDSQMAASVIDDFSPSSATTWQAHVVNQAAGVSSVDIFAMCLSFS